MAILPTTPSKHKTNSRLSGDFVPIKRSLSRLTEKFCISLYGNDFVLEQLSRLSGYPD